jgi:hypothetical protein
MVRSNQNEIDMSAVLRPINSEQAVPVILRTLDMVGLSNHELLNFLLNGSCAVLTESAVPIERLYRFDEGGINPQWQAMAYPGYILSEVRSSSDDLALILEIEKRPWTYYAHQPLMQLGEVSKNNEPFIVVEGQILYVQDAKSLSPGQLSSFITKNTLSWHFLMFCTASPVHVYGSMNNLIFDSNYLVCGVYDGESYLVWTPGKPGCHVQLSKSLQLPVVRRIFGISSIGIKFSLQTTERFQAPDGLVLGHFSSPPSPYRCPARTG